MAATLFNSAIQLSTEGVKAVFAQLRFANAPGV
jgi:hypothetical protein